MKTTSRTTSSRKLKWSPAFENIDVVDAIKRDHEDLKKLIETLKSEDESRAEKKKAFVQFATLLKSHADSEERSLYARALKIDDIAIETHEAFVEHKVADLLAQVANKERVQDRWEAEIKVLGELVEHHIEEEESEFLPEIEKHFDEDERKELGKKFIQLRQKSQKRVTEENAGILEQQLH